MSHVNEPHSFDIHITRSRIGVLCPELGSFDRCSVAAQPGIVYVKIVGRLVSEHLVDERFKVFAVNDVRINNSSR